VWDAQQSTDGTNIWIKMCTVAVDSNVYLFICDFSDEGWKTMGKKYIVEYTHIWLLLYKARGLPFTSSTFYSYF